MREKGGGALVCMEEALAPNNTIATAIKTYLPQSRGLVSGIAHPIEATQNLAIVDGDTP